MKRLVLVGASGSIGQQTINVVKNHRDEFKIIAISVGHNLSKLKEMLVHLTDVQDVCVANKEDLITLEKEYSHISFHYGEKGLKELASLNEYDVFVNAVVGFRGLVPTLTAIENNKDIALANKESLVAGGKLVNQALAKHHVSLYPIDSEHSAIFQCLQGNKKAEVDKLIITASGGSLRDKTREELRHVSVQEALHHPNWKMGGRITIDSATMMNKGFEVMEAHYLFGMNYEDIDVLIHRESVIHSMVQYRDHAIIAQLGTADMRLPIQYALSYPSRLEMREAASLDFTNVASLHFEKVDFSFYPLLELAYNVGRKEGNLGAVMNGADEEAVSLFLQGKIGFLDIENYVSQAVQQANYIEEIDLQDLIENDAWARKFVRDLSKGGQV